MRNDNAGNQPFTFTYITENTNTSLEASTIDQNIDFRVHSQPMDSKLNKTTETDFISSSLDDGTLFSTLTVNLPIR